MKIEVFVTIVGLTAFAGSFLGSFVACRMFQRKRKAGRNSKRKED